jgi:site-specific DNA-cytosine methylase
MKVLTQRDWLQVGDAASLLGVSEKTLRNWDKAGKLRPVRHPINGYRLYKASDIHGLKREIQSPTYVQQSLDFLGSPSSESKAVAAPKITNHALPSAVMHWKAEVALDPKHRPQLWDKPASTVRRDWRKFPQEAHVLDRECKNYRRLTPGEIALLQGFEPNLVTDCGFSDRQVIAALGNAVPPAMAEALISAVSQARLWKNRTALEICAGIGGLTRGASKAGFHHLACVDIDPVCVAFLGRLPELKSAKIESTDMRYAKLGQYRGQIGLLTGGPPCQPWSAGGLRRGSEDDRDILGEMPGLVAEIEPEAFVFENVAGLTTGQNKKYFDSLMERFQEPARGLRYGTLAAKFNAADFGVPQIRERVFIVGFRGESAAAVSRCFDAVWQSRTHRDPTIADHLRKEWRSVGSVIEQLSDPGGWKAWFGNTGVAELDYWDNE